MTDRRPGHHALAFVFVTVLVDMMGIGLIVPVVPAVVRELTGATTAHAAAYGGWLSFAYAAMQFVCAPVIGGLSDAHGRRPVLLAAILGLGIDYALTACAPTIAWLFVGRLVAGACGASYSTANAYVADVTAPAERGRAFGIIGSAWGLGFVLGPALGGLLGGFGPRVPFAVAACLSLLNAVYGFLVLPESLPPERRRPFALARANPVGSLVAIRREKIPLRIAGALLLYLLASSAYVVWAFYTGDRYGWSERTVGASLAVYGLIGTVVQAALVGPAIKRLGERRAAVLALGLDVANFAAIGLATRGWMVFALIIAGAPAGVSLPALNAVMSRRAGANAQGTVQGAVGSLEGISQIAGPVVMSQLFSAFGGAGASPRVPGAPFFFAALLAATAVALLASQPAGGDSEDGATRATPRDSPDTGSSERR